MAAIEGHDVLFLSQDLSIMTFVKTIKLLYKSNKITCVNTSNKITCADTSNHIHQLHMLVLKYTCTNTAQLQTSIFSAISRHSLQIDAQFHVVYNHV